MGQWAAMSMLMVTQSLLVYRLTDSATILGVLALATAIPQMLLFLVGGTMADRFPKRRLIQIGQVAAGAMALAVGIVSVSAARSDGTAMVARTATSTAHFTKSRPDLPVIVFAPSL